MSWVDGVWGLQGMNWPQEAGVCVACLPLPSHCGAGLTQDNLGHCPWSEVTVESFCNSCVGTRHALLAVTLVGGVGWPRGLPAFSLKGMMFFRFW